MCEGSISGERTFLDHYAIEIRYVAAANGISPILLEILLAQEGGYRAAGLHKLVTSLPVRPRASYGIASFRPQTAVNVARQAFGMELTYEEAIELLQNNDQFSIALAGAYLRLLIEQNDFFHDSEGAVRTSGDSEYMAFLAYATDPETVAFLNQHDWDFARAEVAVREGNQDVDLNTLSTLYKRAQYFEYWRERLT